jgi:hypothetical protein
MEISFTVRRGSDDQPLTFSFLAPAVQAALRRGLQAAAQRAQQGQRGEVPSGEGGTNLTAQNVFSAIPVTVPATAPATAAATSAAANSSAASAAAPTGTMGPSPASAVAAAAAATGMAQPDLTRMIERIHRMSGAVAGSIFRAHTPFNPTLLPPDDLLSFPLARLQRTSSPAPFSRARRVLRQRVTGPSIGSSARPHQQRARGSARSAWQTWRPRRR